MRLTHRRTRAGKASFTRGSRRAGSSGGRFCRCPSSGTEGRRLVDDRRAASTADNARYALLRRTVADGCPRRDGHGRSRSRGVLRAAGARRRIARRSPILPTVAAAQLGAWPTRRHVCRVLCCRRAASNAAGRERLAACMAGGGGGVLIAAGPDVDGDVIADVLGAGEPLEIKTRGGSRTGRPGGRDESLAPADMRHPIFRPFGSEVASLGLVQFRSVAHVSGRSCQTIARFTSGDAAVLDCAAGNGRAIVVASDLNNRWNDFPLHATFVPFLHETVRYLSNTAQRGAEYLVGEVPCRGRRRSRRHDRRCCRRIADPRRQRRSAGVGGRSHVRGRLSGVHHASEGRRGPGRSRDTAARESRQHLWQYLLAAMLVALAAEGVVAGRMA